MSDTTTGQALREAREGVGLTQDELAQALGCHRITVLRWEQRAVVPAAVADKYLRVVREIATSASSRA